MGHTHLKHDVAVRDTRGRIVELYRDLSIEEADEMLSWRQPGPGYVIGRHDHLDSEPCLSWDDVYGVEAPADPVRARIEAGGSRDE